MKNTTSTLAWAYHITFRTYKSWCHGDERKSVDRKHNQYGSSKIPFTPALKYAMNISALESELILNMNQRKTVLNSVIETCEYNSWKLLAVHVRSNHAHVVLRADIAAERVMGKMKCYATKALKKNYPEVSQRQSFWGRHGSTQNIWAPEKLFPVLYYVVENQGKPMALR